jgi:hypothetical protein
MKKYSLFISSSDSYSDIWPIFFDLFIKYWPEFEGEIYLNTEEKIFIHKDLNIKCTQVGKQKTFGQTFRKGLDIVPSDNLLLIMIDYIFMGRVNNIKIQEYFYFFIQNKLDSLCLVCQNFPNVNPTSNRELVLVFPPAPHIMFSYQIAFWNKALLYEMALPHENPWSSEWYGTLRAEKMKIKLASVSNEKFNPIPYNPAGCLHKGKWLADAKNHLNNLKYGVDFKLRGDYQEPKKTIINRIKVKWMLIKDGLMGSYFDLIFRNN